MGARHAVRREPTRRGMFAAAPVAAANTTPRWCPDCQAFRVAPDDFYLFRGQPSSYCRDHVNARTRARYARLKAAGTTPQRHYGFRVSAQRPPSFVPAEAAAALLGVSRKTVVALAAREGCWALKLDGRRYYDARQVAWLVGTRRTPLPRPDPAYVDWVSLDMAAVRLGMTRGMVKYHIWAGRLPIRKIVGRCLVHVRDIRALADWVARTKEQYAE